MLAVSLNSIPLAPETRSLFGQGHPLQEMSPSKSELVNRRLTPDGLLDLAAHLEGRDSEGEGLVVGRLGQGRRPERDPDGVLHRDLTEQHRRRRQRPSCLRDHPIGGAGNVLYDGIVIMKVVNV